LAGRAAPSYHAVRVAGLLLSKALGHFVQVLAALFHEFGGVLA
jgi:hypothetical protein